MNCLKCIWSFLETVLDHEGYMFLKLYDTQVLEIMAFKADMRKIMLTCFKHNPAAQKFFKGALKYEIDETCPGDDVYEQHDYEVN